MDPKVIHIACHHHLNKINWESFGNDNWVYCGVDEDFDEIKVANFISDFFIEPDIYLVIDRNNSFETTPELSINIINKYLKDSAVILTNKEFTKMIEFNKIGVMKRGSIN